MRKEIPLPVSGIKRYGFRVFRERDTIFIEPASIPEETHPLALAACVGLIVIAAAGYLAIINAIERTGDGPDWWFHVLVVSFAVLLFTAIGFRWHFDSQFHGAVLSRHGLGTIHLAYHWRNRGEQVLRFREPACVQILLRHDSEGTISWHDVSEAGSGLRKERFRDEIEIELLLQATAIAPVVPMLTQRLKHLAPSMYLYFKELGAESNRASAVEMLRPLADALRECVGITVEIRVAGGPLLERFEARQSDMR